LTTRVPSWLAAVLACWLVQRGPHIIHTVYYYIKPQSQFIKQKIKMGCCGSKEEKNKGSALFESSTVGGADDVDYNDGGDDVRRHRAAADSSSSDGVGGGVDATTGQPHHRQVGPSKQQGQPHQDEGLSRALREEQARLELIVQAAGRRMVAVRSTRGSTGYYDQGFAAALAQHLERTTEFPARVPVRLPRADGGSVDCGSSSGSSNSAKDGGATKEKSTPLYARLAAPQWDGIGALGLGGPDVGHGGSGAGKNPAQHFDDVAESFLEQVIPKKERIFAGCAPIMENLL